MKLKSLRNVAGLSVKALSERTGIAESTLWSYERNNALPNRETAKKLATVY